MIDEFDYETEETIFKQGTHGDGFFILKSGALDVVKDGQVVTTLMTPGTIFGEIGHILDQPRTSSIVARSHCKVLRVTGESLESIVREHPAIASKIITTLAKRLEQTTQKLYGKES
jgi:CRP-like cAMP-binding protein